jgi:hypothetical protein
MRKVVLILTVMLGLGFAAFGAEQATGTWKATIDTPNGSQDNTFVLKEDSGKVTGTVGGGMLGTQQLSDGKLDGDKISFSITTDFGVITYKGTIKGDDMNLTLTVGDGQFTVDLVAHRAKDAA